MSGENKFLGWPTRQIVLPNGDRLICLYCKDGTEPELSLHDINHNIFRLNAAGEVVWQVRRDDSNHPADWWDNLHAHARERGEDGAREPFMYMWLTYPDGTYNKDPKTGMPPDIQTWVPGSKITLDGSAYQTYILDPETGIARNVTEGRPRPW